METAPSRTLRHLWVALPWVLFSTITLLLILDDLDTNPILDEQQWLQDGLATPYNKFLRTGLASGPFPGLLLGFIFTAVYLLMILTGICSNPQDFVVWFLGHQGLFYFLARVLVAGIAVGGLALMARALSDRVGGIWAGILATGFAFTSPVIDRIGFCTPHAAMVGFAGALVWSLLRASEDRPRFWMLTGAIVAAATMTMTSGLGLGLAAFASAGFLGTDEGQTSRGKRLFLVLTGFSIGLVISGYPALLRPEEYWRGNILYQINRQVLTDDGGKGSILAVWAREGLPLWLAGLAGLILGKCDQRRAIAWASSLTAAGYLIILALFTRSAQPSHSLPALPFLAFLASGLLGAFPSARPSIRVLAAIAVFILPVSLGATSAIHRLTRQDPKAIAAEVIVHSVPPGKTLLIDSWWGPRLAHSHLLLSPYGDQGKKWCANPSFEIALQRYLPPGHNQWNILDFPRDIPKPGREAFARAGIHYVAVSRGILDKPQWKALLEEGTLIPVKPLGTDEILLYQVSNAN